VVRTDQPNRTPRSGLLSLTAVAGVLTDPQRTGVDSTGGRVAFIAAAEKSTTGIVRAFANAC
jgi:hypothetical protein